jgi:hydroxyacylglutathione hydrolase
MKSAQVVDIRDAEAFLGCAMKGSLALPKDMLGAYAGYFLDYDKDILLVGDDLDHCKDANNELRRLGYDNVIGLLKGGMAHWETSAKPIHQIQLVSVNEIDDLSKDSETVLVDVRKPGEWESGIIEGARTLFLGDLEDNLSEFDKGNKIVTYCGSGKRATIAASLFKKHGFENVACFMGSMKAYNAKKG